MPTPINTNRALELLLDPAADLPTVAARLGTTLAALADWFADPTVRARLQSLRDLAVLRTDLITAETKVAAIDALAQTATAALQPPAADEPPILRVRRLETARKAATQILRPPPRDRGPLPLPEGGGRGKGSPSPALIAPVRQPATPIPHTPAA